MIGTNHIELAFTSTTTLADLHHSYVHLLSGNSASLDQTPLLFPMIIYATQFVWYPHLGMYSETEKSNEPVFQTMDCLLNGQNAT